MQPGTVGNNRSGEQRQRVENVEQQGDTHKTGSKGHKQNMQVIKQGKWWNWTGDSGLDRWHEWMYQEWVNIYQALADGGQNMATCSHTHTAKRPCFSGGGGWGGVWSVLVDLRRVSVTQAWHFTAASLLPAFPVILSSEGSEVTAGVLTRPLPPKIKTKSVRGDVRGRWHHPASLIPRDPPTPRSFRDCARLTQGPPRVNDEKEINMAVFQRPAEP